MDYSFSGVITINLRECMEGRKGNSVGHAGNDLEKVVIPKEFCPGWWNDKKIPKGCFVIIPDTEFEGPTGSIQYSDSSEGNGSIDYCTGVIVRANIDHVSSGNNLLGYWCHYRQHAAYAFHPFRKRFSNGTASPMEGRLALLVRKDDIVLITNNKIDFNERG